MKNILIIYILFVCAFNLSAQVVNVEKGDVLVVNGVKGIVFSVDESGCHGTMMSLKAFRGEDNLFCSKTSLLKQLSMESTTDGIANTQELFSFISANNIDIEYFPVFNWCKTLGSGWYIPAIEQLKAFVNFWLGNEDLEVDWDEDELVQLNNDDAMPHTKKINNIIMKEGGIPFLNGVFSSTLSKNKKIDVFNYNKADGSWTFSSKNPKRIDKYSVGRAFYDF